MNSAAAAKSLQLCLTLCNPTDGSPPGSPSLGFSRQEYWSGLPFPSPMHESEEWKWSCSAVSDSQRPHGLQPTRLLRPWDSPGKSAGVGASAFSKWLLFCCQPRSSNMITGARSQPTWFLSLILDFFQGSNLRQMTYSFWLCVSLIYKTETVGSNSSGSLQWCYMKQVAYGVWNLSASTGWK